MSLTILLHSSKTMRTNTSTAPLGEPQLLADARHLAHLWQQVPVADLQSHMKLSPAKAAEVQQLYANWPATAPQTPAIDAFSGDIYSGLQAHTFNASDRAYAHQHLLILSGLYGGLRACDGVMPYRLEMGYKLPNGGTMYTYWGNRIAALIPPETSVIINLSAIEYTKAILPHTTAHVITPKFLTISPKTSEPTFVTVHAKVARGAFAHWLITQRVHSPANLRHFTALNYAYNEALSTPTQPVFICQQFGGLGLSVRKAN